MPEERHFFESEAMLDLLQLAWQQLHGDDAVLDDAILSTMSEEHKDSLNDLLVELLREEIPPEAVTVEPDQVVSGSPAGFGARLKARRSEGEIVRMDFFRIRESKEAIALSLLGLTIGLLLGNPGAVIPAVGLARTVYGNLVTLRSPDNDAALKSYQAILSAKAAAASSGEPRPWYPTLKQIHAETGHTDITQTVNGLTTLLGKRLAEVIEWAGEKDDYTNANNKWNSVY